MLLVELDHAPRALDGLLVRARLQDGVAAGDLDRLGPRAIGRHHLATPQADLRRLPRTAEATRVDHRARRERGAHLLAHRPLKRLRGAPDVLAHLHEHHVPHAEHSFCGLPSPTRRMRTASFYTSPPGTRARVTWSRSATPARPARVSVVPRVRRRRRVVR